VRIQRWLPAICCAFAALAFVPAAAPQDAGKESFDILEYVIDGNALLSALQVERAVYPFLGPGGSIERVEKARAALEKAYHDAGYLTVLVDIPEQRVRDGVVRLKVTEGRVERVRVRGARYYSQGEIRERVPALGESGAPFFPEVQSQIAQLNRGADRRVTPVLKPGTGPGTVEVELNVEDKLPLHGGVELNNRYSANTAPLRLSGMLRYDNLWQKEHSITLIAQTAPEETKEVQVLSASYLMPGFGTGDLFALYAVDSRSDVAAIGTVGVIGRGRIFGARAFFPLAASGAYFHTFSLGIDYKDFDENVRLQGADSVSTPISYAPLTAQYSATRQDTAGVTQFNLGVYVGVRGLLGSTEEEFANKRFKAHANYAYLRGDVQRTQNLPARWSLVARLDAQLTDQPLVSNEQFFAGGYDSVRGYLEAEQLGDHGVRGSLEVRTPSFDTGYESVQHLYALGFLEGAELRIREPLPGQTSRFALYSAGLGLRLRMRRGLSGYLDVAWPFETTTYTASGDTVVKFRLLYEF
jgi:hemolysin activation/secretion protein